MDKEVKSAEINTVGALKKWLEVLQDEQKIACDIQLLQDKDKSKLETTNTTG